MQNFSNRLISLRKERGLTQEDLANLIHKKRSTVSGYETEGKEPDLDTVCWLANYFGVSTDYLLGYSDERNHVEQVFFNDKVNFERHYKNLPAELRPVVSRCFDSFYLLLSRDMQLARPERLRVSGSDTSARAALNACSASSTSGTSNRSTSCCAVSEVAKLRSRAVSRSQSCCGVGAGGCVRVNQRA